MAERYPYNFQVFYFFIVRGATLLGQTKAINAIFRDDALHQDSGKEQSEISASDCTKILNGSKALNETDVAETCSLEYRERTLSRIDNLLIQGKSSLGRIKQLLRNNILELDESTKDELLSCINSSLSLREILYELLVCALKCTKRVEKEVIDEIENILANGQDNSTRDLGRTFFISNYNRPLFWSFKDQIRLKDLYVINQYRLHGSNDSFDDLEDMISSFLFGDIRAFLMEKNICQYDIPNLLFITGYAGSGKTSLISKIADHYSDSPHADRMYYISLAMWEKSSLQMDDILDFLGLSRAELRESVLILDGLDEVLKTGELCQSAISALTEEFHALKCKVIITCRRNLIDVRSLRYCMEVYLSAFNTEKAEIWLEKYREKIDSLKEKKSGKKEKAYEKNADTVIDDWKNGMKELDSSLANVILTPLILYICVTRNISPGQVDSLGKLYDLLFNSSGVVPITNYRDNISYQAGEWEDLRNEVQKISILMHRNGSVSKSDIMDISDAALKEKLALDFFVDLSAEQVGFEHSSIWQYFVAEAYYNALKKLNTQADIQQFLNDLGNIASLNGICGSEILSFIEYFIVRDNWVPSDAEIYQYTLLHIGDYPVSTAVGQLETTHVLTREIFTLSTLIYRKFYPKKLVNLFQELSKQPDQSMIARLSNLYFTSPFASLRTYRLNNVSFDWANFSESNFKDCIFTSSHFHNAHFNDATLIGIYANDGIFDGSDFSKADMENADFSGASLIGCNFQNASLGGVNFTNANMAYSDLRGAKLLKTKLDGNLYQCKMSLLQTEHIDMDQILNHSMQVYDENGKLLSRDELESRYKELHPVPYLFWKFRYDLHNR